MSEHEHDEFLAAVDRVAAIQVDPATFPRDASPEFRVAAAELLHQIARIRFEFDGGDLEEFDELDVEDTSSVIDLEDLREFVAGFHAEGDQPRYSACAAVFDWVVAEGYRPPQG
jgi:hypothetical protein